MLLTIAAAMKAFGRYSKHAYVAYITQLILVCRLMSGGGAFATAQGVVTEIKDSVDQRIFRCVRTVDGKLAGMLESSAFIEQWEARRVNAPVSERCVLPLFESSPQ